MYKNGFLTLCFSFFPGAGQMYQGYMKRGLAQVILFVIPLMIGGVFFPVVMVLSAGVNKLERRLRSSDHRQVFDFWCRGG